jgi:hypothetical protein
VAGGRRVRWQLLSLRHQSSTVWGKVNPTVSEVQLWVGRKWRKGNLLLTQIIVGGSLLAKGRYSRYVFIDRNAVFASKLPPTGLRTPAIFALSVIG